MALTPLQEQIVTALGADSDARVIRHSNYHAIHASKAGRCELVQPDEERALAIPNYTVRSLISRNLIEVHTKTHRYAVLVLTRLGRDTADAISRRKPDQNQGAFCE